MWIPKHQNLKLLITSWAPHVLSCCSMQHQCCVVSLTDPPLVLSQCSRQPGRLRVLRAAALCERLLLRPCRQRGRPGGGAVKRHPAEGQLHPLLPAGPTHPHGRHWSHCHANPLAAIQRRRGQRICETEVGDSFCRGGQMRESWTGGRCAGCSVWSPRAGTWTLS